MRASLVLLFAAACSGLPAPQAQRDAFFFAEQRAGRVGYIGWPPLQCQSDADCKAVNGSYCVNDPTKTAPFFCHESPVYVSSGLDKPVGVGMDSDTMQVFFTEDDQAGGDTYHPLSVAGVPGKRAVVLPKLLDPQGIDLDKTNRKVYYTEHHGGRIGVVDYDGKNQKVLHQWASTGGCGQGECPSDVKVDTGAGKIFAMVEGELSDHNLIVSMELDGSNVTTLADGVVRAYGLTLDKPGKRIFYISGGHGGFIGSMTYEGKQAGKVLDGLDWPYMLDLDPVAQRLVFSETGVGDGVISTVNTDGSNVTKTLTLGFAPMGVTFGKIPSY